MTPNRKNDADENSRAGHRRRLRERFLRGGLKALQDYEAVELLLTFGIPRRDVKPLAKELIARFGSLNRLLDADGSELLEAGLGVPSAVLILLSKQLCAGYLEQRARVVEELPSQPELVDFLRMKIGGGKKESLMVLFLNARHALIDYQITPGTVDRAAVYSREVAERALLARASAVVLAHNHPSGCCTATREDYLLTQGLEEALGVFGIKLLDHLIVAPAAWKSIKEE